MNNRILNKFLNDIMPFKTAIFAVVISVVASFGVSLVSDIGKQIINDEMNAIGMSGMSATSFTSNGNNDTGMDFYESIKNLKEVSDVSPIIFETATAVFQNGLSAETMVWGINNNATEVISLQITEGRMLTDSDVQQNAMVCIVDENLAKAVYQRTNINGKTINVKIGDKTANLKVIWTIKKGSNILNTLTGDVIPNFIYIPYTTMKNLSPKPNFDQVVFTSSDTEQTASEFKQKLLETNYRYKNKTIKLTNLSGQKEQIGKIADTAFMSLFIVSVVAVIVCSLSVAASVNTAVISRQKDIGIKMSMGAGRADITAEFLLGAMSACIVGIIISVIIMLAISALVSFFVSLSFQKDYSLIVLSIFVTIFLTAIFSLIPSYKAAQMHTITALNRE